MSGSRLHVDINSQTRVNVSKSRSGSPTSMQAIVGPPQELPPQQFPPQQFPPQQFPPQQFPQQQFPPQQFPQQQFPQQQFSQQQFPQQQFSQQQFPQQQFPQQQFAPQQFVQQPPPMAFAPMPQMPQMPPMGFCPMPPMPPMPPMYGGPGPTFSRSGTDTSQRYITMIQRVSSGKGRSGGVDKETLAKLEAGFKKLQGAKDCHSLLKKYLTREVFDKLKQRKTAMGATLLDVIQSGIENLDSGVGLYAPDAESYRTFAELFDPVIDDYHKGFKRSDRHPPTDFGDMSTLKDVDPTNKFVVSTRIRCARSLVGYPFNPCLTESQYKEMEKKVTAALRSLEGELSGTYYPLTGMDKDVQQQLIDDHFLFKEGDRFLQAANSCRFWPTGRGIFHNDAKTFLVWVNEEDHLRIISMQKGGNIREVFSRLVKAVKAIEKKLPFSRDDRFGYLTFCPTNLGTTIRASVHIKVPKLAKNKSRLDAIAAKYELQVRGTSGEHTESKGGVYDVSNKRRLGLTEYEAVRTMQEGILELIKLEKEA